MTLRTGVDLIEVNRVAEAIERHGERFLNRVFTVSEQKECNGRIASLAARFAAKEAVAKALGTGIGDVSWLEIEIRSDEKKAPYLVLSGEGERLAKQLGLTTWSVSLSHTQSQAIAFVVMTE
ncbi:MAG: holo-ACP synthase [Chloroflexi bacterium]|nr:holo-ACP synthase [Chloroflexota bacterium]MBI3168177.1 holo-ACP synthase [Chloroflexota bacterium]